MIQLVARQARAPSLHSERTSRDFHREGQLAKPMGQTAGDGAGLVELQAVHLPQRRANSSFARPSASRAPSGSRQAAHAQCKLQPSTIAPHVEGCAQAHYTAGGAHGGAPVTAPCLSGSPWAPPSARRAACDSADEPRRPVKVLRQRAERGGLTGGGPAFSGIKSASQQRNSVGPCQRRELTGPSTVHSAGSCGRQHQRPAPM